jgi:hypothetical protein
MKSPQGSGNLLVQLSSFMMIGVFGIDWDYWKWRWLHDYCIKLALLLGSFIGTDSLFIFGIV